MTDNLRWTRRAAVLAGLTASSLPLLSVASGRAVNADAARPLTPGGWAFSATRLCLPAQKSSPTAPGNRFQQSKIYLGAPTWKGRNWRFLLPNLHVRGGAVVDGNNPIALTYLTLFDSGGAAHPITVGGETSVVIPQGGLIWSDPVQGFENDPDEALHLVAEVAVQVGETMPLAYMTSLGGADLGEGRASSSASDPGPRAHGRISPTRPSNGLSWGPSAAVSEGWDGERRVFAIFGDSRDYGVNDMDYKAATRGCAGAAARGLDDAASGRAAFGNFSIPGARAETLPARWSKLWAALDALPNRPFHDVVFSLNGNDENGGQYPTPERMMAYDAALYEAFHQRLPDGRLHHLFGYPWVEDRDHSLFTTIEGQAPVFTATAPDGVTQKIDAWLRARTGLPAHVVPIDLGPAMTDPVRGDRWPVPAVSGTLRADATGGRTLVVDLPRAPAPGDNVVVTVGRMMAESFHVSAVAGTGPYTLTTAEGIAKYHMAGDAVALAHVRDGVHPGTKLNIDAARLISQAKASGTIRLR